MTLVQPSAADRELLQVALRNTHNAARLVRSLGDLAFLDEPAYRLQTNAPYLAADSFLTRAHNRLSVPAAPFSVDLRLWEPTFRAATGAGYLPRSARLDIIRGQTP